MRITGHEGSTARCGRHYFQVSNGAEVSALRDCLTENGVVRDEGHVHQGHEAILAWLLEAQRKYAYSVEPLDVARRAAGVNVRARVAGNFPGSPIELEHAFQLADDRIESLEIHG